MSDFAVYINGIFDSVLEESLDVQRELPEEVLYLQPHKSQRMVKLAENPPSPDDPVRLLASTTDDLNTVQYAAEIIKWRNKSNLNDRQKELLDRVIKALQPNETGLYLEAKGSKCVNLLSIRNLRYLSNPFSVNKLTNVRDNTQLSDRTQAGGWVYVRTSVPKGVTRSRT